MRFSLLLAPAALATSVLADGAAIIAAISAIENATIALNNTVTHFPAGILGLADVIPLLVASTDLLNTINQGTATAKASANLTTDEALAIVAPTETLVADVNSTLTNVIAAKKRFDTLLVVSPVVLLNLKEEKTASDNFGAAVVAKVPAALQAIAESLLAPIDDSFNEAIADYE